MRQSTRRLGSSHALGWEDFLAIQRLKSLTTAAGARQDFPGTCTTWRADFAAHAKLILAKAERKGVPGLAPWMAQEFDRWGAEGGGLFVVGTAMDFESKFGALRARSRIEVPPYAELLLQGWHGLAIRHPEYMLARDLEFLFLLYQQAEEALSAVNWRTPPEWARYASEHVQALARAVIQTCFNLLEWPFVSSLSARLPYDAQIA